MTEIYDRIKKERHPEEPAQRASRRTRGRFSRAVTRKLRQYPISPSGEVTMLTDGYDLPLSTASGAARDAYVEASHLALTFYPGAADAYDRAIAADPGFALVHAGKAQVLMRQGDAAAA